MEHGFNVRPDLCAIDNNVNPREYCGKFWVDSLTHDARMFNYVVDLFGARGGWDGRPCPAPSAAR